MEQTHISKYLIALLTSVLLHIVAYYLLLILAKHNRPSQPRETSLNIRIKPPARLSLKPQKNQEKPLTKPLSTQEDPTQTNISSNNPIDVNEQKNKQSQKKPPQTVKRSPADSAAPKADITSREMINEFINRQPPQTPTAQNGNGEAAASSATVLSPAVLNPRVFSPTMRQSLKDTEKFRSAKRPGKPALSHYKLANQEDIYVSLNNNRCFEVRQNPKWGEQQTWWSVNCREQPKKLDIQLDAKVP